MKKRIAGLLLLFMLIFSVPAFASYQPDLNYWKFIAGNDEVSFYFSPKRVVGTYEYDGVATDYIEVYTPKGITKWVPEKVRNAAALKKTQVAYKLCRVNFGLGGEHHNIPTYGYFMCDYKNEKGSELGVFSGGGGPIKKGTWIELIANAVIEESRRK